jgi:hypothetical protein
MRSLTTVTEQHTEDIGTPANPPHHLALEAN